MSDDLDLRQLLGDEEPDVTVPSIPDTPASQLNVPEIGNDVKCSYCDCWMAGIRGGLRVCTFHTTHHGTDECVTCKTRKEMHTQGYIEKGHKLEPVHPIAVPSVQNLPESPLASLSPDLKDEAGDLDSEYYATFNGTIEEIKDLEPEVLQDLRHRLDRMIRRAKIQQRAIRITEEGKLSLIDEKRRKNIKIKDAEWMARRKKNDAITGEATGKAPKAAKSSSSGLSQVEKQVKQFVKLNMNEATIRATLQGIGQTIPSNLVELIQKYQK